MPRKKTEAAEAMTESLGPTLPAVVQQEGEYFAAKQGAIERIESMFQFPDAYDRDETVAALRNSFTQAGVLYAYSGALLMRIKAHESHGDFTRIAVEVVGKSERTIRRMMLAAQAMLDENGKPRPILLAIAGTNGEIKKLHELMSMDTHELDKLDAGGMIGELSLETAPIMSPSEMRDALAAANKQVDAKTEKNNELEQEIAERDREIRRLKGKAPEILDERFTGLLAETQEALDAHFKVLEGSIAELSGFGDVIANAGAPNDAGELAKRTQAINFYNRTVQLAETASQLITKLEMSLSVYLDSPRLQPRGGK